MNIIIAAAKTGGHVYPAIEVGKKLLSKGNKVFFIGNGSQIEKNALKGLDFEYKEINIDGVRGKSLFNKIFSSINIISKIFTIWKFINKNQIKAMVGFGGFITVPIGIASLISGVKVFTQEQNSVMGSANKLLSKFAVINFLGFPLIKPQKNSKVYGNPVRDSFTKNKTYVAQNNIIKIYITGGSQGSQYLNTILPTCFRNNKFEVEIRHQCGIGKKHGVNQLYEKSNINSVVKEFFDDPSEQVDWCDYVVCRSGALTISEVSSMSKGALMIPLPSAIDNHQLFNAEHIVNSNLGIIHQEKNGVEDLKNLINKIIIEGKEFKNTPGLPKAKTLFNLHRVKTSDNVYIVESSFDSIRLDQVGIPSVATLGANVSKAQVELLQKYFNNVIVVADNDEAGGNMKDRIIEKLGSRVSVIKLDTKYKDIGDMDDDAISGLQFQFDKSIMSMLN